MTLSTDLKGQLAVLKIQERAIEKGIIVSIPTIPCRYDLVMDIDGVLKRVQCKYANGKPSNASGAIMVRTASLSARYRPKSENKVEHRTYTAGEIDFILAYLPVKDVIIKLDPEHFVGKEAVSVRFDPPKNNQSSGLRRIDHFIW